MLQASAQSERVPASRCGAAPLPEREDGHFIRPAAPVGIHWEEELRDWPSIEWPDEPIRAQPPSRRSLIEIRLLTAAGLVATAIFFVWLFAGNCEGNPWLFWPLALSLGYHAMLWVFEWISYAFPKFEQCVPPRRAWKVDVLTTACPGEPRGMILRTLRAMQAIRYPHTSYLCDEGNDPLLREACRQLGVIHVTRTEKRDAKAGNINNALRQATGEIAVVLDPDHEPAPHFLDRVLGYFEDERVGFVQTVQAYRNHGESFVAGGAAKQTYLFYGPIMTGLHARGSAQAIGANCVFRRAALDSIGGHAPGLAEDMHTTMLLYAQGWRSIYAPEVLTRGLVPATLPAYCKQQAKWACGSLDLLVRVYPRIFTRLTFWQKVHYFFAPLYFLRGFATLVDLAVPAACLAGAGVALKVSAGSLLAMYAPAFLISNLARQVAQRWAVEPHERGTHLTGAMLGFGCWWTFVRGAMCGITGFRLPYIPTEKESEVADCWGLVIPNLLAIAGIIGAMAWGLARAWTPYSLGMAGFALWGAVQVTVLTMLSQQRTMRRVRRALARIHPFSAVAGAIGRAGWATHAAAITVMRRYATPMALVLLVAGIPTGLRILHPAGADGSRIEVLAVHGGRPGAQVFTAVPAVRLEPVTRVQPVARLEPGSLRVKQPELDAVFQEHPDMRVRLVLAPARLEPIGSGPRLDASSRGLQARKNPATGDYELMAKRVSVYIRAVSPVYGVDRPVQRRRGSHRHNTLSPEQNPSWNVQAMPDGFTASAARAPRPADAERV